MKNIRKYKENDQLQKSMVAQRDHDIGATWTARESPNENSRIYTRLQDLDSEGSLGVSWAGPSEYLEPVQKRETNEKHNETLRNQKFQNFILAQRATKKYASGKLEP